MEKIFEKKTVEYISKQSPILWQDVKHIQFEDEDVIEAGFQEETFHSNGGDTEHFYFTVTRKVLETDEEFEERKEIEEFWQKNLKEKRYQSYLKLKEEFEK